MTTDSNQYEMDVLFWYDGPQLWIRTDKQSGEHRLFVSMGIDYDLSGIIDEPTIRRIKKDKMTLRDCWNSLKSYRKHAQTDKRGNDVSEETYQEGEFISSHEARCEEPLGDAFLNF